jgi:hypothetical protein
LSATLEKEHPLSPYREGPSETLRELTRGAAVSSDFAGNLGFAPFVFPMPRKINEHLGRRSELPDF